MAKLASPEEGAREIARRTGMYEREVRFYREVAPRAPLRVPSCPVNEWNAETGAFLLILEHIDADPSVDQLRGVDGAQAGAVMRSLAALHAAWWQRPELESLTWVPALDGPMRRANLASLSERGWPRLRTLMAADLSPAERRAGEELPARIDRSLQHLGTLPATLLHGDTRLDNVLFDRERGGAVLVDWQGLSRGAPAFDLAYFLTHALTTEARHEHQAALMDCYVRSLSEHGVAVAAETIVAGYGEALWFGLTVACSVALLNASGNPRSDALAAVMARRSLDALADAGQIR